MCGGTQMGAMPGIVGSVQQYGGIGGGYGTMQVGQLGGADGHGMHDHHVSPKNPPAGDPRFLQGSVGPVVSKNDAPKIDIPDGKGFGGLKGRKQNDGDKAQNRYSTTDANFFPTLGLLPKDPDTGKQMTYVQHIQAYNAAGYISAFAPEVYAELVRQQDAGNGTVLGGALYLMGIVKTPDPAASRIPAGSIPMQIPGTPLNARDVVMSPKDATGQDWARPHHAESSWAVFKQLMGVPGMDYRTALVLSGDDAVSGAGRLNGFNNQDGNTGLNADERAVFKLGASLGPQVFGIMLGGHNHTGLHDSAKTNPKINKLINQHFGAQFAKDDRSSSPERVNAIYQLFASGKVAGDEKAAGELHKFQIKDKTGAFKIAQQSGPSAIDSVRQSLIGQQAPGGPPAPVYGSGLPPAAPAPIQQGGCGHMDAHHGTAQLGGPLPGAGVPDLTAILAELRQLIARLAELTAGRVAA